MRGSHSTYLEGCLTPTRMTFTMDLDVEHPFESILKAHPPGRPEIASNRHAGPPIPFDLHCKIKFTVTIQHRDSVENKSERPIQSTLYSQPTGNWQNIKKERCK